MAEREKAIDVYAAWLSSCPIVGKLYCALSRGEQVYSFEFSDSWLSSFSYILLDPDLYATRGRQYVPSGKKIFGMFSDCCPDRWGRTLLKRKEAILANEEKRSARTLYEIDYLLGVNDETRMGGFRFKIDGCDSFLSVSDSLDVPPVENLRMLEQSSLEFEESENPLEKKWLMQILNPGSSLGGARPKATLKDIDGSLWVSKFPSKNDEINTGAWEFVVSELARMCGLDVPETKIKVFNHSKAKNGATFLSKRFDRTILNGENLRLHYESAMTLLGKTDGASFKDGTSYLEIAEFIKANSIQPKKDLQELWKRILFNMLVSNTDDHLRNHGFVLGKKGWKLSPLFDVNPNPDGDFLSLNVTDNDNSKNIELALETAEYYCFSADKAKSESEKMAETIAKNWRTLALQNKIEHKEIELMARAFGE